MTADEVNAQLQDALEAGAVGTFSPVLTPMRVQLALAERLRQLHEAGLVESYEMPAVKQVGSGAVFEIDHKWTLAE